MDDLEPVNRIPVGVSESQNADEAILERLHSATGTDFKAQKGRFNQFITFAQSDVNASDFYYYLTNLHEELTRELVVDKIRAIDSWSNGESAFHVVPKKWSSVVDKLYRMNILENNERNAEGCIAPPHLRTILDQANKSEPAGEPRWITPDNANHYIDDLLRTKFVVPFADGVVNISEKISQAAEEMELRWFWRYHAKDSGYHARHLYVILPRSVDTDEHGPVALEIKVLTKLQDTLGELTHMLYELKRTGRISTEKKRKLAWMFDSPDFEASYLGHTLHYMESSLVRLRKTLEEATTAPVEGGRDGES